MLKRYLQISKSGSEHAAAQYPAGAVKQKKELIFLNGP